MPEKPTNAYWAKRAETRMESYMRDSDAIIRAVNASMRRSYGQIEQNIESIYRNFAKVHDLTPVEAKRILASPVTFEEYERLLKEIAALPEGVRKRALMMQADTGAYAHRISVQEGLRLEIGVQSAKIAAAQQAAVTNGLADILKKAFSYTAFDVQKGIGVGFQFGGMDKRAIQEILSNP